jgi:hypothetical protein
MFQWCSEKKPSDFDTDVWWGGLSILKF